MYGPRLQPQLLAALHAMAVQGAPLPPEHELNAVGLMQTLAESSRQQQQQQAAAAGDEGRQEEAVAGDEEDGEADSAAAAPSAGSEARGGSRKGRRGEGSKLLELPGSLYIAVSVRNVSARFC